MSRALFAAVAVLPLMLAAGSAVAQSHGGHAGHGAPVAPAADPHAGHNMSPAPTAGADPHAGHGMNGMPKVPAQTRAADPHAGHDMGAAAAVQTTTTQPTAKTCACPKCADGGAAHDCSMPGASTADPHAGHDMGNMSTAPAAAPAADPHAGHDMDAMQTAPVDPHAGHDMGAPADHDAHAGHQAASAPAAIPVAGPPPGALSGPAHAADSLFGAEAMAGSRRQLLRENGNVRATAVIVDHVEAGFGDRAETYGWDVQGWTGGDINRFWWKTEGEGDVDDGLHGVEVQALYSRAVAPFWDVQAGVRHDFNRGRDDATHLVLGVQGVAPHWWEVDAAAFLSTEGDLTARVSAEYDQRITQTLILQPAFSLDLAASDIPERETGAGLVAATAALRLRYEIRKEFAPYVGVEWRRAFGDTADYARARGEDADGARLVVGITAWF
ncbi:copper resistance protein B [Brevundimonas naejangsanensis]|uniref:Copper resistance protein B n=1 Tax=Brevundimonas naejangsanensis TaxID=588932 RepID=A0A494RGZ2_9CAUL|nr:copper resistance protein B [Brevundimonas naejangsanensis]AYG95678.1 copper resistance protein B [Brevundimonas naejangsanensis]